MMPNYAYRGSGKGKAGIKRDIGATIYKDVRIHDDGLMHFGGISLMTSGPMGCGKTTFLLQLAQSVGYVNSGMCKSDMTNRTPLMPETVIWRGRKYDYWNTLIASNWKESFPLSPVVRPVCVHIKEGDDLTFFEQTLTREEIDFDGKELGYAYYKDAESLFKNLIPTAINVVYEPNEYFLNPDVVKEMVKKSLEDLRLVRLKKKKKGKLSKEETAEVEAPSSTFWFEFLEYLQGANTDRNFYSVFMDESHQVCPMNPVGELYHLGGWMSNQMIDFRRNNISLFLSTHDIKLVDYRVVDRVLYFSWMPAARLYPRISAIRSNGIIGSLNKGEMVLEESNKRFGFATYDPIPNQPPMIYVDGLRAST
jgi:energy-coupling factor transporter ATP-binding protein EcfA2